MDAVAVIVAAGRGVRMGEKYNKLLLPLGTSTIIECSLEPFLKHTGIHKIFLTVASQDRRFFERLIPKEVILVEGGKRRQDSVHNALLRIVQEKPVPEIVLVHDGARPFCSAALIDNILAVVHQHGAVIPVLPIVDTIRRVKKENTEVFDRTELFAVQTPQGFHTEVLKDASMQAVANNWNVTDDASLVEKNGGRVATVEGELQNIKITTPEDLEWANYVLNSKKCT